MNIHEYQAKEIFENHCVKTPQRFVACSPDEAVEGAKKIQAKTNTKKWAVKAQIHAGGRGKGGGVKLATSLEEVRKYAEQIIGMTLVTRQTGPEGKVVKKILIQEDIYDGDPAKIREFYISVLLNRSVKRNMIIYSTKGGMDIEEVAEKLPELIFKEEIDPLTGLLPFQARHIAKNFGLSGKAFHEMVNFVTCLYKTYDECDLSLVEINPMIKTADDRIFAVDAKIVIEDNALFRHPEFLKLRDLNEEDPLEIRAKDNHLNYIKLDGNVGCMVNGAGLAMATMDLIKLSGGAPANFLDVGGGASAKTVEAGFRIILDDPHVKAILINIFGGIVRCDRVATGIVEAYKNISEIKIPIIVRLQGTNAEEAKKILDESGLKMQSAIDLDEAAKLVKKVLG